MTKRRRKPDVPALPPEWIDNPRQNAGCVVEEIREPGKATRKRRTRESELLRMMLAGRITQEQAAAGQRLAEAYLKTLLTPSPQEKVDRTPRPDERTVMQVEALTTFAKASKVLTGGTVAEAVKWVCCEDRPIRERSEGREVGLARNGAEELFYRQSLVIGLEELRRFW